MRATSETLIHVDHVLPVSSHGCPRLHLSYFETWRTATTFACCEGSLGIGRLPAMCSFVWRTLKSCAARPPAVQPCRSGRRSRCGAAEPSRRGRAMLTADTASGCGRTHRDKENSQHDDHFLVHYALLDRERLSSAVAEVLASTADPLIRYALTRRPDCLPSLLDGPRSILIPGCVFRSRGRGRASEGANGFAH